MINSWFYQLQDIDPVQVGNIKADVKVVDYSRDGTHTGRFSPRDVWTMRNGEPWTPGMIGGVYPRVLSYLSIGEAERYRSYWKPEWDKTRPEWLSDENPDWPGNYKVAFWHGDWKNIIYDYLDDIMDAGFDGVYLDIIDAYEYWEDNGIDDAAARMIRFVRELATYAQHRNPFFWIVPQNGEGLLSSRSYRAAIDAIAKEDLIYGSVKDGSLNIAKDVEDVRRNLEYLRADGKPVLVVEYVSRFGDVNNVYGLCRAWGFIPLVASRALNVPA